MRKAEFEALLRTDPRRAMDWLFAHRVEEWLQDGPEEVARILSLWATNALVEYDRLDLGYPRLEVPEPDYWTSYAEDLGCFDPEEDPS